MLSKLKIFSTGGINKQNLKAINRLIANSTQIIVEFIR